MNPLHCNQTILIIKIFDVFVMSSLRCYLLQFEITLSLGLHKEQFISLESIQSWHDAKSLGGA